LRSSQPLSLDMSACVTSDLYLKFDGIKGESRVTSVSVSDVDVDGEWRVESTAPLRITGESSSANSGYIKVDGIKGESTDGRRKSSIEIDSFTWGSSLSVQSTTPTDFEMSNSRVRGGTYLKYEMRESLSSSFNVTDCDLGDLDVSAAAVVAGEIIDTSVDGDAQFDFAKVRLERLSASTLAGSSLDLSGLSVVGDLDVRSRQPITLSAEACTTSDMYLKFEGVKGMKRGAAVSLRDCAVDGQLTIESTMSTRFTGDSSTAQSGYIKLEGIKGESSDDRRKSSFEIDSFSWGASLSVQSSVPTSFSLADSTVEDELSLSFATSDASSSSFQVTDSEIGALHVEGASPTQGTLRDSSVDGDTSFHFMKIREPSRSAERSSLTIDGLTVVGSTFVQSDQPLSVVARDGSFLDQVHIQFDGVGNGTSNLSRRGEIDIQSFSFGASLSVETVVPMQFSVANTRVSGDMTLRLDGIKADSSSSIAGRFTARDFVVGGGLTVVGSESSDVLRLERAQFGKAADVRLAGGADRLMLVDSLFASSALFDGGAGEDVLGLPNTTFKKDRVVRNWESIVYRDDGK